VKPWAYVVALVLLAQPVRAVTVLPRLLVERREDRLDLRWEVPAGLSFPMPVEVRVGDSTVRVPMSEGEGSLPLAAGAEFTIDPDDWILRADDAEQRE
jgi:hypothetical protein